MLTSYSDDDALFSSIMAGASGYVLKEVGSGDLLGDIRRVSQGMSLLDPALTQELFDRLRKDQEAESRLTVLTPQERRVLELIAQGQSNRQIAEQLFLAEATRSGIGPAAAWTVSDRRRRTWQGTRPSSRISARTSSSPHSTPHRRSWACTRRYEAD